MQYRDILSEEVTPELFDGFERQQQITRCWRKDQSGWTLRDIAFTEDWTKEDYRLLCELLKKTLQCGGAVFGAFSEGRLIGFCSVENEAFGSQRQYRQLSYLHISNSFRRNGTGRVLMEMALKKAKKLGAKKLYISAHSSEESQAFYQSCGCTEAEECNHTLRLAEPYDIPMECKLDCNSDET